jgi:hypothetical protein
VDRRSAGRVGFKQPDFPAHGARPTACVLAQVDVDFLHQPDGRRRRKRLSGILKKFEARLDVPLLRLSRGWRSWRRFVPKASPETIRHRRRAPGRQQTDGLPVQAQPVDHTGR